MKIIQWVKVFTLTKGISTEPMSNGFHLIVRSVA
jgi:hypothetical protein